MISQTIDPRLAGEIARYHTWPTIGQQTCANHQWNVARILLAIWPEAPRALIVEALFHDVGEMATGDIPYPVKKNNPRLKDVCDPIEKDCRTDMWEPWGVPLDMEIIGEIEIVVLKIADYLDMWEFALLEAEKGNRHAQTIINHIELSITELKQKLELLDDDYVRNNALEISESISYYSQQRRKQHFTIMGE